MCLGAGTLNQKKETGQEVRKIAWGWSRVALIPGYGLGFHSGGNGRSLLVLETKSAVFWFALQGDNSGSSMENEREIHAHRAWSQLLSYLKILVKGLSEACLFPPCFPSIPGSWPRYYQQPTLLSKQCHCHFMKTRCLSNEPCQHVSGTNFLFLCLSCFLCPFPCHLKE